MTFDEVLAQVRELLQQEQRVSYRGLKRRFALDDEYLEDLKEELIGAKRLATDEDGRFLLWTGGTPVPKDQLPVASPSPSAPSSQHPDAPPQTLDMRRSDGERRQLTVQFIDLVGSTTLSQQLDPEDYHARVVAYQTACQQVIARYEGHIAQYLGDGVLVYFGSPVAHEDDAVRAVRSGLEIVTAVSQLAYVPPLQVRIGIHTGPVVVGEIGAGERTERLALGETPNLAARVQGVAEPATVVISQATSRLVQGFFRCEALGSQSLKNVAAPLELYRVQGEGEAHTRFEVAVQKGLTPLVGRESELGLLWQRWEQAKTGAGQVVLLSGEPGIGKSRLVQELKEHVSAEGATRIEFRCSPYHQNTALYPITEHLQRLLQFQAADPPHTKLAQLAQLLSQYRFPQAETLPLLAALFSLPSPEGAPPLSFSPQKQKQLTLEALVAWLLEEAERAVVYCVWEDLHWADPSTLEFLALCIDQVPTAHMLMLLTFRPEFTPSWASRSHLSHLVLSRLGRKQSSAIVEQITGGKALPTEVLHQVVAKTDGVPLFVEELTKMVLESGLLREEDGRYVGAHGRAPLPLGIPATLHDALMARLDRLGSAKEVAQLGATLGREFSYELLQAVSSLEEGTLHQGLKQLIEAELVYQKGLPPHAHYLFKHALIQDAAYQLLLKSTRQQYHQQIAQILEERFPETKDTHPELVAHHYTAAGLREQAIPYWQQAGQRAVERSANVEAISHLTTGLELLKTLPDTLQRSQQELLLQLPLGAAYLMTRGNAVPEVSHAYNRAYALCQQLYNTPQLIPALFGLYRFYYGRAEYHTARQLGEQLLGLAEQGHNSATLVLAHYVLGTCLYQLGEAVLARVHLEQGMGCYDPKQHRSLAFHAGIDPGIGSHSYAACVLWLLGYPDQALTRRREALSLAEDLAHPSTQAHAFLLGAFLSMYGGEAPAAQEWAEHAIALSREQGNVFYLAQATITRGWALAKLGREEEGVAAIQQSLVALRAPGAEAGWTLWHVMLAQVYTTGGQTEEGLTAAAEGLAAVERNNERFWEAELYRLKGELTLQKFQVSGFKLPTPNPLTPNPQAETEAEACFLKAIEIARRQSAKSWELRAVMSLAKLWQQQGKQKEAHEMLSAIYAWFTEGFDTKDLQEAKALLEELT